MEFFDDQGRAGRFPSAAFTKQFQLGRQQRKTHAAARSPVHAGNRATRRTLASLARAEKTNLVIKRRINRELGLDRERDIWGRSFQIRMKVASANAAKKVAAALKARTSTRTIMTYSKPIRDGRGRIAVFMRVRYRGFKSPGWRAGMTGEHIDYIFRVDAIEPALRESSIITNMGDSIGEIAAGWRALEEVEKAYRANAIVQHRIVLGMPYQLSPAGRRRILRNFCERAFERYGLPYAAANHSPDANGDQRNFHAHVAFSTRPMSHISDHQWEIVQEKVNGITDPAGLLRMRALFAAIVNRECRREGLDLRFTHQDYKKRGIDASRQEHLGPQLAALFRKGDSVDMAMRNEAVVKKNEAKQDLRESTGAIDNARQLIDYLQDQLEQLALKQEARRNRTKGPRLNPAKENSDASAVPVIDGVALLERLRRERIYVGPNRKGLLTADRPLRFSESERDWMRDNQDQLSMLRRDQQKEIATLRDMLEQNVEAYRTRALRVDDELDKTIYAYSMDPAIGSIIERIWPSTDVADAGPSSTEQHDEAQTQAQRAAAAARNLGRG